MDLPDFGLDRYAKDDSTEVLMLAWAFDDDEPKLWLPCFGEPMPAELHAGLVDPTVMKMAWNYNFEKDIFHYRLGYEIPQQEWFDPSVLCAYMSLPIGLDRAADALNIDISLKKTVILGKKKPTKIFSEPSKRNKTFLKKNPGAAEFYYRDWNSDPEQWEIFKAYCIQDVVAERAVWYAAVAMNCPITEGETQAWLLDQRMNEQGVWIDKVFVANSKAYALGEIKEITESMQTLTGLAYTKSGKSLSKLDEWLQSKGYKFDSLDKAHIAEALKVGLVRWKMAPVAYEVLQLREKLGGSAYTKLQTIEDRIGADGRLRDQFVYHGAHTGRWCIAEGSLIRVKELNGGVCEKPIEKVLISDLVWDGNGWTKHEGVVFSGEKDVVEVDGVTATKEHEVWVNETTKAPLGAVTKIWRGATTPYIIYRLTSPSGKCYFGLSKNSLKTRWYQHVHRAKTTTRNHPLLNAIRKWGKDSFKVEVVDFARTPKEARLLEISYIASMPKTALYNLTDGGETDGETGGRIFWQRMRDNPELRKEYLARLSSIKKAKDWSNYAMMTEATLAWRHKDPQTAYQLSRRNLRRWNRNRSRISDGRPLVEKLRWKHNRSKACSLSTSKQWANRTLEERAAIRKKISDAMKRRFQNISTEERRTITARAREQHIANARSRHENV